MLLCASGNICIDCTPYTKAQMHQWMRSHAAAHINCRLSPFARRTNSALQFCTDPERRYRIDAFNALLLGQEHGYPLPLLSIDRRDWHKIRCCCRRTWTQTKSKQTYNVICCFWGGYLSFTANCCVDAIDAVMVVIRFVFAWAYSVDAPNGMYNEAEFGVQQRMLCRMLCCINWVWCTMPCGFEGLSNGHCADRENAIYQFRGSLLRLDLCVCECDCFNSNLGIFFLCCFQRTIRSFRSLLDVMQFRLLIVFALAPETTIFSSINQMSIYI